MATAIGGFHPRSRSFFNNSPKFEKFIAHLATGARWKVLSMAALIAFTDIGLLLLPDAKQSTPLFQVCILTKIILFVAATVLFCFTSWILWPARILASTEEIPKFQRKFRIIAIALISMIGLSMALGVISSHS